jgi:hypothetical protein
VTLSTVKSPPNIEIPEMESEALAFAVVPVSAERYALPEPVLTIEPEVNGPMKPAVCGGAEISCVPSLSLMRTPHAWAAALPDAPPAPTPVGAAPAASTRTDAKTTGSRFDTRTIMQPFAERLRDPAWRQPS